RVAADLDNSIAFDRDSLSPRALWVAGPNASVAQYHARVELRKRREERENRAAIMRHDLQYGARRIDRQVRACDRSRGSRSARDAHENLLRMSYQLRGSAQYQRVSGVPGDAWRATRFESSRCGIRHRSGA